MIDGGGLSAGLPVLPLVLGTAEDIAACHDAFASRQMQAAPDAAHHVLAGTVLPPLLAARKALAVALQQPVGNQHAQDNDQDFRHAIATGSELVWLGKYRKSGPRATGAWQSSAAAPRR